MWKRWVPAASILLLAVAVYANSLPGTFILDDRTIVAENPLVARLDLRAIFSADYWGTGSSSGLYRPLTILSFALNRLALGDSAAAFRVVNILLHAAVSVLLLALFRSLRLDPLLAWFAAACFAVHPIHAEPVNELVGRSELLAALFVLAGLVLARSGRVALRLGALPCYAAALLSKEQGVVFPALLLLTDAFTDGGLLQAARKRRGLYLSLALAAAGWLALRFWVQGLSLAPRSLPDPVENPLFGLPLGPRLLTALEAQALYLAKLLLPLDLRAVYASGSLAIVRTVLSLRGLAVAAGSGLLAAWALRAWARRTPPALALWWYAICASVTANLFFTHAVLMAERFAYLPSAGFAVALPALLLRPAPAGDPARSRRRCVLGAALALYLLGLGGTTMLRNAEYRDPVRLWRRAVALDPDNPVALAFLGDALDTAGDRAGAEAAYRSALRLGPDYEKAHALGQLLLREGRIDEAQELFARRVARDPGSRPAWMGLAQVAVTRGRAGEALEALRRVGASYRGFGVYWHTRGWARELQGDLEGAAADYREALRVSTPPPDVPLRLSVVLLRLGRASEAEAAARTAAGAGGGGPAYNELGIALAAQGRRPEAVEAFRRAVALDPEAKEFRDNLELAERGSR